ncbi:DUF748 domain-containing protein [bacterium]|nr:DUF748 domain-containing protein [bacterium]
MTTLRTTVRHVTSPYPFLPEGYWYKGGAPRELLRRIFHPLSSKLEIRDFDIFRTEETEDTYDHQLAMKYLVDDYEFGRGVEVVEDMETYFATRDLTVNEVALHNARLRFTDQAQQALREHTLTPTSFVCNALGEPLSQTFVKALRLKAEGELSGVSWSLSFSLLPKSVRLFDAALHLDRTLARGLSVGYRFVELLHEYGYFTESPSGLHGVIWFIRQAEQRLPMGAAIFRHLPREVSDELVASR